MKIPRLESELSTAEEAKYLAAGAANYVFVVAGAASISSLSWKPIAFGAGTYAFWLAVLVVWSATVEPRLKRQRVASEPAGPPALPLRIPAAGAGGSDGPDDDLGELQDAVRRLLEEDAASQSKTGAA